jgi:uncharacterized protein YndB with AHSA1/START domain
MQQIRKTVEIHAPVSQVFEYLCDPTKLPEIWPNVVEVTNVKPTSGGSSTFDWTYKLSKMTFHGHCTQKVVSPKEYVETVTRGPVPSSFRWTFETKAGWCEVTFEVDYTVDVPVVGRLGEAAAAILNERELNAMLARLRNALEVPLGATKPVVEAQG